jgi:sporulation protein YlmC with PRC-barrel domain
MQLVAPIEGLLRGASAMEDSMATSVDTRETTSLISSDKVDGTAVYGSDGEKIGSIEHLMIDKISGKVAYAVLTFGGFMGFGEDFYPIPWSTLEYDTNLGGYRLDVTKEQLKTAPKYTESTGWNWNRQNDETIYSYYMAPPYWSQLT